MQTNLSFFEPKCFSDKNLILLILSAKVPFFNLRLATLGIIGKADFLTKALSFVLEERGAKSNSAIKSSRDDECCWRVHVYVRQHLALHHDYFY